MEENFIMQWAITILPSACWKNAEECLQFCQSIYGKQPNAASYAQNAYRLCQQLIQPFKVLLFALPEQADAYHNHLYLLHRYQMAYSFSAALSEAMARQPAAGATGDRPELQPGRTNPLR